MNNQLSRKCWYFITQIFYKPKMNKIGKGSVIYKPLQFNEPDSIAIGNRVFVAEGAWLVGNKEKEMTLQIRDGSTIGHFSHIVAKQSVVIGENVLLADKVFISDCVHGYKNIEKPVQEQELEIVGEVTIGEGSWLGENVCVCGANIGTHCVIGANAVVVKDIPDYCVAVGNPAKVIRRYNPETKSWDRV